MKKLFALFMVLALCLCGMSAMAEVKASDISEKMKDIKYESGEIDFNADLSMTVSGFTLPVKADVNCRFSGKVAGGKINVSVPGILDEMTIEYYGELTDKAVRVYVQDEEGKWGFTESELPEGFDFDQLKDLDMAVNFGDATVEEGDTLVVKTTVGDLLLANGFDEEMLGSLDEFDEEYQAMAKMVYDSIKDVAVSFEFDKEFNLLRVFADNIDLTVAVDEDSMDITGSMVCEYKDMNNVPEFEIPADIIEAAEAM